MRCSDEVIAGIWETKQSCRIESLACSLYTPSNPWFGGTCLWGRYGAAFCTSLHLKVGAPEERCFVAVSAAAGCCAIARKEFQTSCTGQSRRLLHLLAHGALVLSTYIYIARVVEHYNECLLGLNGLPETTELVQKPLALSFKT